MSETAERLIIAEDERVVARRLRQVLETAGYQVPDIVGRSGEVLDALETHRPAVLLLDIGLERDLAGLELAESGALPEEVAIVFVSGRVDETVLERVQQIAPAGFVVKPYVEAQLLAAVRVAVGWASRNGAGSPRSLARQLSSARDALGNIARELRRAGHLVDAGPDGSQRLRELPDLALLSPRERDVLRELLNHRRPPTIARELCISQHTVRNHLRSIFGKLGVHSQAELIEKVLGPEGRAPGSLTRPEAPV